VNRGIEMGWAGNRPPLVPSGSVSGRPVLEGWLWTSRSSRAGLLLS